MGQKAQKSNSAFGPQRLSGAMRPHIASLNGFRETPRRKSERFTRQNATNPKTKRLTKGESLVQAGNEPGYGRASLVLGWPCLKTMSLLSPF